MHQIIYLSWAAAPFTSAQLQELLKLARRRNTELAITGILLYGNERFLQVLEGGEEEVRTLYEVIRRDARHEHIIAYVDKPITQRTFKEWAMAFQPTSPQQAAEQVGYLGATDVALDLAGLSAADRNIFELLRSFTMP